LICTVNSQEVRNKQYARHYKIFFLADARSESEGGLCRVNDGEARAPKETAAISICIGGDSGNILKKLK